MQVAECKIKGMKYTLTILCLLLIFIPFYAYAGDAEQPAPIKGSPELQRIKSLSGKWTGTTDMGKGKEQISVEYKVTSNGSAVVETLFPDTPHEMVSVYYDIDGRLAMTHYCSIGNQPQMVLNSSTGNTLDLEFAGGNSIDPSKDTHMHSLSIAFISDDSISETWTSYMAGSANEPHVFSFHRVK